MGIPFLSTSTSLSVPRFLFPQNAVVSTFWLFLATIASAAPISDEPITTAGNNIGYGTGGGIAGLIILILDIIVIIEVLQSNRPAFSLLSAWSFTSYSPTAQHIRPVARMSPYLEQCYLAANLN